ncbi:uncharacterized protein BDR25DRAFT_266711 [Lindgomyces ingoldianus]|uniref:Uncharacterized protein n=1 Tax=Lindgomyces ingoldianus TaxID=673940 RepID=A0ACB6QLF0_9PLEO|nr:uncharacterized protein BDR25DRAFT_266711 [Lindgomyces ingoldianus]KAF2467715.1 hypothetical protein BDR25DRAFT_266711 [Lindgomyces ingoldianus]
MPMPPFRISPLVSKPVLSPFRLPRPLFCNQPLCLLRTTLQTRGKHGRRESKPVKSTIPTTQDRTRLEPNPEPSNEQHNEGEDIHFAPNQGEYKHDDEREARQVRVRYLRPALWAVAASSGIYALFAYWEAKSEVEEASQRFRIRVPQFSSPQPAGPAQTISQAWNDLDSISRLSYGIIAVNGLVHLTRYIDPNYWNSLWHTPALNHNYTLLTHMFVHSGPAHLLFNMYACYNFLRPVARSQLFEGSSYHTLSFFLSAGILSGYAQHWSTIFASRARVIPQAFIPCGGASGAIFAIFSTFCMQYPDSGIGIILLPFSFEAQYFLPCIMAFDLYGMVFGFKSINWGHAAHFSGALIGVAYSYFDGKIMIWDPLVRFFRTHLEKKSP